MIRDVKLEENDGTTREKVLLRRDWWMCEHVEGGLSVEMLLGSRFLRFL